MSEQIRKDAQSIINRIIKDNHPGKLTEEAVKAFGLTGRVYLAAIGKAGWTMAEAAINVLGDKIKKGVVITKYGHSDGCFKNVEVIEAGHPLADENSVLGTQKIIDMVSSLTEKDQVLFLISGGGSALFEKPAEGLTLEDITDITGQLLACGANIVEINMIRKRLSAVKAGRFAEYCKPAAIYAAVLSDVLGDRLDSIASGPAAADPFTSAETLAVTAKYKIRLSDAVRHSLMQETPKTVENIKSKIIGNVRSLCVSAAQAAADLRYKPHILTENLTCEAREAGSLLASLACVVGSSSYSFTRPCALIVGGETVVHILGNGRGGRNQELALSAAPGLRGLKDTVLFSIGSDGTDGPTDAAGGMVDGESMQKLTNLNISVHEVLSRNDSYTALDMVGGLIKTGPTGTNINDVAVLLCK